MQGKTINGFTLQRPLGTGGMAEVWYAENEIGMKAAVKVLSEELSHSAQMQDRFLNEAKVMVKLDHPNIRKVYGFGNIDGRPSIIMEYLDGKDLKALMKQGRRFSQEELEKWWNQLVDALNYTHDMDIVHRDIKPSNIFIDQKGNAKLLDFGIAKVADTTSGTLTGSTLGTRIYMSPEQVKDPKRVGTASDVYSLSVTFVHLLTGKAPYDSTTNSDYDIQVSIVTKPVDMSGVPAEWQGFLMPYLAKEPEQRPPLRPFEADCPKGTPVPSAEEEDATQVDLEKQPEAQPVSKPTVQNLSKVKASKPEKTQNTTLDSVKGDTTKSGKSKKGLWIGLAIAAAAVAVLVFMPKSSPDTNAYQACQTVEDYRAYLSVYGENAKHYSEAKSFVDQYVADSLEQESQRKAMEEAKKAEDAAYSACTTITACDSYLEKYPDGRYVTQVQNKKAELEKNAPKNGSYNGHDYVDLGLPSGTLWATCNVGASNPEDYGNYYAWGETTTKSTYTWKNYKHANGGEFRLTKYCDSPRCGNNGFTDKLTTLRPSDDAATANWGSGWRIPSNKQLVELRANTTKKWTTQNGVKGYLFTGKNGESVFFPAAGYCSGWNGKFEGKGSFGCYWLRSMEEGFTSLAWRLYVDKSSCNYYVDERACGMSIRPVRED